MLDVMHLFFGGVLTSNDAFGCQQLPVHFMAAKHFETLLLKFVHQDPEECIIPFLGG